MQFPLEQSYYRDRVAVRYYNKLSNEFNYDIDSPTDREKARKRLTNDQKVNVEVFKKVIREIFNEQIQLTKTS